MVSFDQLLQSLEAVVTTDFFREPSNGLAYFSASCHAYLCADKLLRCMRKYYQKRFDDPRLGSRTSLQKVPVVMEIHV